jgi:hypothetical protein
MSRSNRGERLGGQARIMWLAMLLVCAMLLGATLAQGGVTGSISGTVTDSSGAIMQGVTVTALSVQTGVKQQVTTNAQGFYEFLTLPVGGYEIDCVYTGFTHYHETGLILDVNTALRVDITLQVGTSAETVSVKATSLQVDTTTTEQGEVIGSREIMAVPLNGRSYTDLLALQPGVSPAAGVSGFAVSGSLSPGLVSVSGQRQTNNAFLVNDATVNEGVFGGTAIIPNLDSIAEFRLLTTNVSAEYGNYNGGQVNAVTKSGTNRFHGDAFNFLRNTDLDARNFYDPSRGKYIQNQFGGTFGGPVKHDKVFFFADYQGTRQIIGVSTGLIPVPSAQDLTGNLSDVAQQLKGTVGGASWASTLAQELGYPVTAGEAYYTPGCASSSQCVFPHAVIPPSAFSAPTTHILQYFPKPNVGPYFDSSAFDNTLRDDKGAIRVDGESRWGRLSGYYFLDDFSGVKPFFYATVPGWPDANRGKADLLVLSDTKSFGAAVNEVHFSFTRDLNFTGQPVGGLGPSLSSLGFTGIFPEDPQAEGVMGLAFNNYTLGISPSEQKHAQNIFQVEDNYMKVIGTHTLKIGGTVYKVQLDNRLPNLFANGNFSFNGSETGFDFADFLIGAPDFYIQGGPGAVDNRAPYLGLFGEDSWRVNRDITLNYGLRWEVMPFWHDTHDRLQAIVPGEQSVVFPGAPEGWVFPGDPNIPSTLVRTGYKNFAPRIGLAYAPSAQGGALGKLTGGPGKMSIRLGFGVFYSSVQDDTDQNEIAEPPYGLFYVSPLPSLFANPFIDRSTAVNNGQRFPVTYPPPPSPSHPNNTLNWAQFEPLSVGGTDIDSRVPESTEYSAFLQRQLGRDTLLNVGYAGSQGHRLVASWEANPGNPALCLSVSQPSEVLPGTATCGPFGENGVYYPITGGVINSTRQPLGPNWVSSGYIGTIANSSYNALEVSVRHTSGRMTLLASYTYSKSLDNSSDLSAMQINPLNFEASKGLSSFDITNNFVFSYSCELPVDKLFRADNRLTRGWMLSGITRFATGVPVLLSEQDDRSLVGTSLDGVGPGEMVDTPQVTAGNLNFTNPRSGNPYFNTSLFSPEPLGQFGNSDRSFFHGPGINNWDMGLQKDFHLTEAKTVEFRGEFFSVFNHAQFGSPNGNLTSGTFGLVTTATGGRVGQLGLKFLF